MEHPSGNVQPAAKNVGPEKGTWVRAKDNRCRSHSLGGDRENQREEMASLKKRRAEARGQDLSE